MRKTLPLTALIAILLFCMPSILAMGAESPPGITGSVNAVLQSPTAARVADVPCSITLNRSSADLEMHGQMTLTATASPAFAPVTWTSSRPSVATVDQSGIITGHQVGMTTITATVSGLTSSASATCNVYVHLADGIYIIENADSGLCLNSNSSSTQSTTAFITQLDDSNVLQPKQSWKIMYTTSGFYVIRPLENLDSILTVDSSGNVVIIPYAEDATVQIMNRWKIGLNNLGYYLYHKGLPSSTLKPVNSSTTNSGLQLIKHSYDSYMHWNFTPVEGFLLRYTDSGIAMSEDDTIWLDVSQSHSLTAQGLAIEYYGQHESPTWSSSNNAVSIDNSGTATVNTYGTSIITVEVKIGNNTYYKSYEISASARCVFYGIPDVGHDHAGALAAVVNDWRSRGWENITFRTNNVTTSTCIQDLKTADIFIFRGHGNAILNANLTSATTGIILNNTTNVGLYSHTHSPIATGSYVVQNTDTFFNLDLVIFIGCHTGYGGEDGNNLPNIMEAHGAKVAIGFASEIPCEMAEDWTVRFIEELMRGQSITQAINEIANDPYFETTTDQKTGQEIPLTAFLPSNVIVCGDENFVLFPKNDP